MSDPLESFLTSIAKQHTLPPENTHTFKHRYHPDGYILPSLAAELTQKIRATLSEDTCCSFDEWKAAGYWIKKGSKSMFQDALGVPQFTIEQVEKSKWQRRR